MSLIYRTSSIANTGPSYIKYDALTYEEGDGNIAYLLTNMSGSTLTLQGATYITGSVVNIAGDAELQKRLGLWDNYDIEYVRIYAQSSSLDIKKDGAPHIMLRINDGELGIGQGLTAISGSIRTNLLSTNRVYRLPNASGTLALSVNGSPADNSGNITITSFVGSFTGSLQGTASWAISASTALTASFVTSSNVYGPYGSNSILTASYAVSSSYIQSINVDGPYGLNSIRSASFAVSASWAPSTPPGGATMDVQFNSASVLEGTSSFKYNFLSQSLEQGDQVATVGTYSHAEGGQTKVGTNLAYSASIVNGVATLVASYGSISSSFNVDSYLIVYDVSTQTISPTAYQISQSVYTIPNTIVRLYDTTLNVANAFVGDVYYYDLSWNGDQQIPAQYSHTEGYNTRTLGRGSHAEGNSSIAAADYAHAEGDTTQALGEGSHAEGSGTVAKGAGAHAEGSNTLASGDYSHAEGFNTQAIGLFSHAAGTYTIASGSSQFVIGRYNIPSPVDGAFVIGNGTFGTRRNLLATSGSQIQITGSLVVSGSITGSLLGTASWSSNSLTASFITASNVYGPHGSSSVLSSSFALSASWAPFTATNTGSLLTTASATLNVITFTKGDGSQFNLNINTGSTDFSGYTTIATFNSFTASYNTGSFTGSFTGRLIGTASWSSNSLTASFVTASNVYGPHGANSITSASYALSASYAESSSYALSASYSVSSSHALSASWAPMRPAGSDTQIQFNSGSALSGSSNLGFDYVNNSLSLTGSLDVSGSGRFTQFVTASKALFSGSGTNQLTVVGSGSVQPLFQVIGSQGELFTITDSLSGSLFSVNDISGLSVLEAFSDSTVLIGNYQAPALNTTVLLPNTTAGANTIYTVSTGSYDAVYMDYVIRSGSVGRAGTFTAMWSGSSTSIADISVTPFGDTSGFVFGANISGSDLLISGSGATAGWRVKTIIRSI